MSGYPDNAVGDSGIGGASFLRKPFGLDDLMRKTHEMLQA